MMPATPTYKHTNIHRAREPWGPMLNMMSVVQRLWENDGWDTVGPAARYIAKYPRNATMLAADGWTEDDFVETCKLLMGKHQNEVEAICKERGWEVPHYA